MILNEYGLIRQPNHSLIGLFFPPLISLSEYEIEVVYPEYTNGYYYPTNGVRDINASCKAGLADISKYDYVIVPAMSPGSGLTCASGLRVQLNSGALLPTTIAKGDNAEPCCSHALCKVDNNKYAAVSCLIDYNLPIIGFKRHRSDHVNPLGIIQPLDPGMLRPQVEDPDVEEKALEESLGDVDPYPEDN